MTQILMCTTCPHCKTYIDVTMEVKFKIDEVTLKEEKEKTTHGTLAGGSGKPMQQV